MGFEIQESQDLESLFIPDSVRGGPLGQKDASLKWHDLGLELLEQKDEEELNQIHIDNPNDGSKCCKEMFQLWVEEIS